MKFKDYFKTKTLGAERTTSDADIKKAIRPSEASTAAATCSRVGAA